MRSLHALSVVADNSGPPLSQSDDEWLVFYKLSIWSCMNRCFTKRVHSSQLVCSQTSLAFSLERNWTLSHDRQNMTWHQIRQYSKNNLHTFCAQKLAFWKHIPSLKARKHYAGFEQQGVRRNKVLEDLASLPQKERRLSRLFLACSRRFLRFFPPLFLVLVWPGFS